MRLTLRTLLAWRDGLLEAPEREELSTKIGERGLARSLLERIEAVSCRSELGVPKLDGRGLAADANSVAAYLDNTLEPEKLEAFERVCLESDVHLAEVAECHAVLAEMTAQPARDGGSRKTLLPLVKKKLIESAEREHGRPLVENEKSVTPGPRTPAAPRRRPAPIVVAEQADPTAASGGRKRRRVSPWTQLVLAAGLLVLSGGGLAVVLWRTSGDGRPLGEATAVDLAAGGHRQEPEDARPLAAAATLEARATPQPEGSAPAAAKGVADDSTTDGSAVSESAASVAIAADEPVAGDTDAGRIAAEGNGNGPNNANTPQPPPMAPEPPRAADPSVPLASGPRVPMGDALAIAASVAPGPDALLPPVMAPEPPEVVPDGGQAVGDDVEAAAAGLVVKGTLVLLADEDAEGGWGARRPGEPLPSESRLLAPPACFPEIEVDGVAMRLQPQSQVVIRSRRTDEAARPDDPRGGQPHGVELEVVFGRVVLRQRSGNAACLISAGPLRWDAGMRAGDALAVEVALVRAAGADPITEAAELRAAVIPLDGDLAWRADVDGDAPAGLPAEGIVPRGSAAVWSSRSPGELLVNAAASPDWIDRMAEPDRLAAEAAEAFGMRVSDVGSVVAAARAMATDRRIESREVAAGTLALIGDYADAVALLLEESVGRRPGERRWRQFEASVVPLALARGVHSARRLEQAFTTAVPAEAGEQLFRLAVGFSGQQLEAGEDARLVAALSDERLGIRRYAALRLAEVVQPGQRDAARYRADAAEELRAEGVRWWNAQLEKGLIRPPETGQLSGREEG